MRGAVQIAGPPRIDKAPPMLADEKVLEKTRRRPLGRPIPCAGKRQRDERSADPGKAPPRARQRSGPKRRRAHGQKHQHRCDGSLRQQPDAKSGEEGIAGDATVALRAVDREPESGHRQRRAEHQRRIGHRGTGRDEYHGGGSVQREGPQRLVASAALRGERVHQRAATRQHRERWQSCGELVDAENGHRDRRQPRRQRRLAPEWHPVVELGREPVAGLEHLARDLGVARFGRVHQRIRAECDGAQRDDGNDEPREPRALARGQRKCHRGVRAAGADSSGAAIGAAERRCRWTR